MLDPQMKRGLLETCIMSALCRGDSYGYKIIKDISDCVAVSESTLYPILRRLEVADAVNVYSVEHNGRLRKMYRLTQKGRKQIDSFLESRKEIEKMYDFIERGINDEEE